MKADRVKANGIHYTPPDLAAFLAEAVAAQLPVADQTLEVLDPACGDGALLLAFSEAVPSQVRRRVVLHGCETDANALRRADASWRMLESRAQFFSSRTSWPLRASRAGTAMGSCLSLAPPKQRR